MTNEYSRVHMNDGVELNVKILNNDHAKPVLIALHGAPGLSSLKEPEEAFAFLTDRFRILVFDCRGSGLSQHVGPYTHDRWIQDIEALRSWVGAEKFVLAGGSYGGFVALEYASRYSDNLLALILRDTWADGRVGAMSALAAALTSNRATPDPSRQVRLWSGTLKDDQDFLDAIQEILPLYSPPENVWNTDDRATEAAAATFEGLVEVDGAPSYDSSVQNAAFSGNMPTFNMRAKLGDIKVPTLVIVGRYDIFCTVEFSRVIAEGIPQAELVVFEKSGHNPIVDEPAKFKQIVSDFMMAKLGDELQRNHMHMSKDQGHDL